MPVNEACQLLHCFHINKTDTVKFNQSDMTLLILPIYMKSILEHSVSFESALQEPQNYKSYSTGPRHYM